MTGLIPVLVTPFLSNGLIDVESQLKLIEKYENLGNIDRYWLFGTGSEDWSIDETDRFNLTDAISSSFDLSKFVIGVNLGNFKRSKGFAHNLERRVPSGDVSIHYMNPYPKYNQEAICETYQRFTNGLNLDTYAYFSDNFTSECSPKTIERLSKLPKLAGIKYSTGSAIKMGETRQYHTEDFEIIPAVIKTLVGNLSYGFESSTTVEANLFASLIQDVFNTHKNDPHQAYKKQLQLNNTTADFKTTASTKNYVPVAEIKYVLSKFSICSSINSDELVDLTNEDKRHLDIMCEKYESQLSWLK